MNSRSPFALLVMMGSLEPTFAQDAIRVLPGPRNPQGETRLVYRSPHVLVEEPVAPPVVANELPQQDPPSSCTEDRQFWTTLRSLPSLLAHDVSCAGGGGGKFWATTDYMVTWLGGAHLPPLVTTSPLGTPRAVAGVLGAPNTNVLFGDTSVNDGLRSGMRFDVGYWFNPKVELDGPLGVEAGFMILESQASFFAASLNPILARPFVDVQTGTPQAVLVAFPDSSSGAVAVRASSGNVYEAHLDITEKLIEKDCGMVACMLGYRFYRHDDSLRIRQDVFPIDPLFTPGTRITTTDDFGAHNEFHGCDVGLRAQIVRPNLTVDMLGKIAVGRIHHKVDILGNQVVSVPGNDPLSQNAGVYAQANNIGSHSSSDWSIMPELGITLNWQVGSNVTLRFGYSAILLNNIARAADQIDFNVNPDLFPPAQQAAVGDSGLGLNRDNIWLQSVNIGVAFSY